MAENGSEMRLVDPGAMLATTHELDSGLCVRLRLTKPSDAGRLRSFLRRVSRASLRLRFGIGDHEAVDHRDLTFYDPRERLVLAASAQDESASEQIVGIADVTLRETGLAEIGMLVSDAHQTKGIGRLMSQAIAQMAVRRGATHLKAALPPDDVAVMSLMEGIGPTVRVLDEDGVASYTRLPAARRRHAA